MKRKEKCNCGICKKKLTDYEERIRGLCEDCYIRFIRGLPRSK